MLCGFLFQVPHCAAQIDCAIDERDVRKSLGIVAQLASLPDVVFFRQEANIIAQREQPLKKLLRLMIAPLQHVIINEPEATSQEGAFAARQSIVDVVSVVA